MAKEMEVSITCFEVLDRTVGPAGHSGRIHVPKSWVGKRVRVVLLEALEE